jgi:hypothetical protein
MAQVQHLPCRRETLSSNSSTWYHKKRKEKNEGEGSPDGPANRDCGVTLGYMGQGSGRYKRYFGESGVDGSHL